MRIVVLDGGSISREDLSFSGLKELGELDYYERTPPKMVLGRSSEAVAILTSKCMITKSVIDGCPHLKYIGVLATGYNMVDLEYAKTKNIAVTNIPVYSTPSVAQFTIGLIIMLANHAEKHTEAVASGMWQDSVDFTFTVTPQMELDEKTLGIIGFGNIGRKVAEIASAIGMKVIISTNHPDESFSNENIRFATRDEVFSEADIISLHCPLRDDNAGFINCESIEKMKDGVVIINTARGPLINEADLDVMLRSGKVRAAALDVLSKEPPAEGNILLNSPNCYITPHIAWSTLEARARLIGIAQDNLMAFIEGKDLNRIV